MTVVNIQGHQLANDDRNFPRVLFYYYYMVGLKYECLKARLCELPRLRVSNASKAANLKDFLSQERGSRSTTP